MARDKTKAAISRGRSDAKAAAAASPRTKTKARSAPGAARPRAKSEQAPASTDIRRAYMKSLLGDYLGKHRGQAAIKPKKR